MALLFSVKTKCNSKEWDKIKRRLTRQSPKSTDVGFWNTTHPSGFSVAQVAMWNDRGRVNGQDSKFPGSVSPPRPFMRIGLMGSIAKEILPTFLNKIHLIASGSMTWAVFNKQLEDTLRNKLQQIIIDWNSPPNSKATIDIKGFDDPLINTGAMFDSVKTRTVNRK